MNNQHLFLPCPCEGLRLAAWTLPLERRTCPHPWNGVWTRPPTIVKLVGSTGKGRNARATWLRRRLSIKGRADVCAVYIFPWSFTGCLYFPSQWATGRRCNNPSLRCCEEVESRWSVDRSAVTSAQWELGNTLSGDALARWKVGFPVSIFNHGRGVYTENGAGLYPLEVQPRSRCLS